MDVVLGCLDSLQARLALNRACRRAGVAWIDGAIETNFGSVSLFSGDSGTCYECGMSQNMWENRNRRFSCGGLRGVEQYAPVPTTAIMASLIAAYMVNEALAMLHTENGLPKPGLQFGQKLWIQTAPYELAVYEQPVNPDCMAHEVWQPVTIIDEPITSISARALMFQAGMNDANVELGFDLLKEMRCIECGELETILRPLEQSETSLTCCLRCLLETREPVAVCRIDTSDPLCDMPLAHLAIPDHAILAVANGKERRYFQVGGVFPFRTSEEI